MVNAAERPGAVCKTVLVLQLSILSKNKEYGLSYICFKSCKNQHFYISSGNINNNNNKYTSDKSLNPV